MMSKKSREQGVVYSTDLGRVCPECGKPENRCICKTLKKGIPDDGIVRIGRETKGRKGAGVTVVTGIELDDKGLKKLAGQLKKKCGTGGTVKSGIIEIQGDKREVIQSELQKMGYTVKLAGG
jgi:translation initiation factor 1